MNVNPVLGRELRQRMRSGRSFVVLTAFLVLLTMVTWAVYEGSSGGGGLDLARRTALGRDLFGWVLFFMLVLVLLFLPSLVAGSIAGERERQTLVPLQVTLLSPARILWGKITASLAYVGLLIVATAPLLAVAFVLGGIAVTDAVIGLGALLLAAFLVTVMMVGISASVRRVQTASVLASALSVLLAVGAFAVYALWDVVDGTAEGDGDPPAAVLAPNLFVLVADLTSGDANDDPSTPLDGIASFVDQAQDEAGDAVPAAVVAPGVPQPFLAPASGDRTLMWPPSLLLLGGGALALFLLGARRLRTPAKTERAA